MSSTPVNRQRRSVSFQDGQGLMGAARTNSNRSSLSSSALTSPAARSIDAGTNGTATADRASPVTLSPTAAPVPVADSLDGPRSGSRTSSDDPFVDIFAHYRETMSEEERLGRGDVMAQATAALHALMASELLPSLFAALRDAARESSINVRDRGEASAALAERDAELNGLLWHQQSQVNAIKQLADARDQLERELRESQGQAAAVERARAALEAELKLKELSLLEARERLATTETRSARVYNEASESLGQTELLRTELRETKARMLEKENELLSATSLLGEARGRLRQAEASIKELRDRNDALVTEFQRIADQVAGPTSTTSPARNTTSYTSPRAGSTGARRPSQGPRSPDGAAAAAVSNRSSSQATAATRNDDDAAGSSPGGVKATLSAVSMVRERLEAVVELKNAELASMRTALEASRATCVDLEVAVRQAAADKAALAHELEAARNRSVTLEQNVKRATNESHDGDRERAQLRDELTSLAAKLRTSERAVESLTATNANLQREAALWERRLRDCEAENNNSCGSAERLREELGAKARLAAHLEAQLATLQSEAGGKDEKLKLYAVALEEATGVIGPLRQELKRHEAIVAALKQRFIIASERHLVSGSSTPRAAHYRSGDSHAAENDEGTAAAADGEPRAIAAAEVDAFVASQKGSIVERLHDVIFAKDEEIRRLLGSKRNMQKALEDAEVTVERLTRDAVAKHDEFKRSLHEALNTFTRVGGYEKLVDMVFNVKETVYKVHALQHELDFEQRKSQKLLVRCRVLERHLEEAASAGGSDGQQAVGDSQHAGTLSPPIRPVSPRSPAARASGAGDFAAKLDAALRSTSRDRPRASSTVLSLSDHEDDAVEDERSSIRRELALRAEARVVASAVTPRGLLFRAGGAPGSGASTAATAGRNEQPRRSTRFAELEAKMAKVDRLREQLLVLENAAATTNTPAVRTALYDAMREIHSHSDASSPAVSKPPTPRRVEFAAGAGSAAAAAVPRIANWPTGPAGALSRADSGRTTGGGSEYYSSTPVDSARSQDTSAAGSFYTPRRTASATTTGAAAPSAAGIDGMLEDYQRSLREVRPQGKVITRWR
jgi:hypothetical protein